MAENAKQKTSQKTKIWVSGYELARIIGVSEQRISALKKQGRIKKTKRGFHVPTCQRIILESRETNGKHLPVETKYKSLTDARTAHETQKAKLAELEFRKRSGELVEKDEMIKFCSEIISVTRTRFLGIGAKVAPEIIGLENIKKIKAIIDAEIHDALNELAKLK